MVAMVVLHLLAGIFGIAQAVLTKEAAESFGEELEDAQCTTGMLGSFWKDAQDFQTAYAVLSCLVSVAFATIGWKLIPVRRLLSGAVKRLMKRTDHALEHVQDARCRSREGSSSHRHSLLWGLAQRGRLLPLHLPCA